MNWLALFVICVNILATQARRYGNHNDRNLIDFIKRRQFDTGRYGAPVLGSPRHPEHLPAAEPVYPGHSLIRPAKGHLKSSIKYPLRDVRNTLVYGNPSTLGLTYENQRLRYSDFRRGRSTDKLLVELAQMLQNHKREYGKENQRLRYSDFTRSRNTDKLLGELAQILKNHKNKRNKPSPTAIISLSNEENDAREDLDIMDSDRMIYDRHDFRRKHDKTKYRKRSNEDKSGSGSSSEQSDEKNPGNPFTIHKNKYKQNFMWNHNMDGDHMNLNSFGPEFKNYGPTGFDLFLGRKWWYFNQDDYKPMS